MDEPIDATVAEAEDNIAKSGVTVVAIGGGVGTLPFAYTAGLTAIGEPELMLLGPISPDYMSITLNNLASRVLEGTRYEPGDVPRDVLEGGYDVTICGPVPAMLLPGGYLPGVAMKIYGADAVRVYQVVYQDSMYRYPWEPGYDMPVQPYLKGGRGNTGQEKT